MIRQTLVIDRRMPGLNEYIAAMNRNRHIGNKMKQEWTEIVAWECKAQGLKPVENPVSLGFLFFEPNARRDPDNITFAKKFILDGLVVAGVLPSDSQKWITGFNHERWIVSSEKQGVQVTIVEVRR
jgi:Holliday junction resolvase RusA-like endonuclease